MNQTTIRRMLIENLADRYLPKLQFDPNRSIRKLVDMGECLSRGKVQKRFFQAAQKLLEKENSPYYALVQRITSQFDPRAIKTFGMNLGFNSWIELAGQRGRKTAPPWTVLFHLEDKPDALSLDELTSLIRQSVDAGIHTFLFWLDQSYGALDDLMIRIKNFSDCAFALFTPAGLLSANALKQAQQTHNLLLSIKDSPGEDIEPTARALRSLRCPFALHTVYSTSSETENILCGKWVERVSRMKSPFAFFFPGADCPEENHAAVRNYARALRTAPQQPVFSMSLCDDVADVDELLSGKPRLLKIGSNGFLSPNLRFSKSGSCSLPVPDSAKNIKDSKHIRLTELLMEYSMPLAQI